MGHESMKPECRFESGVRSFLATENCQFQVRSCFVWLDACGRFDRISASQILSVETHCSNPLLAYPNPACVCLEVNPAGFIGACFLESVCVGSQPFISVPAHARGAPKYFEVRGAKGAHPPPQEFLTCWKFPEKRAIWFLNCA